jgi:hypothetical protein
MEQNTPTKERTMTRKTVKTANAGFTKSTHPSMFQPEKVRKVVVDGVTVGHYTRNKYGVTIGHFDAEAVAHCQRDNPFVLADSSKHVYPTIRGVRNTKDVVTDIADGVNRDERSAA